MQSETGMTEQVNFKRRKGERSKVTHVTQSDSKGGSRRRRGDGARAGVDARRVGAGPGTTNECVNDI
jgi:hypothetical protein